MDSGLIDLAGGVPADEANDRRECLAAITATVRALQGKSKSSGSIVAALAIATVEVVRRADVRPDPMGLERGRRGPAA